MRDIRERLVVSSVQRTDKGVVMVVADSQRNRDVLVSWACSALDAPRTGEAVAIWIALQPDDKSIYDVLAAGSVARAAVVAEGDGTNP